MVSDKYHQITYILKVNLFRNIIVILYFNNTIFINPNFRLVDCSKCEMSNYFKTEGVQYIINVLKIVCIKRYVEYEYAYMTIVMYKIRI